MPGKPQTRPLFDPLITRRAAADALRKLDLRHQLRNPVMFVVEIGSILTTLLFIQALLGRRGGPHGLYPLDRRVAVVHRVLCQFRRGHG